MSVYKTLYSKNENVKLENDVWKEKQKLLASDPDTDSTGYFGASLAIDGNYAIIGQHGKDHNTGSAYIFKRDNNGNWTQKTKLTASDAAGMLNLVIL